MQATKHALAAHGARMSHASSALWPDGAPDFVHALIASDLTVLVNGLESIPVREKNK